MSFPPVLEEKQPPKMLDLCSAAHRLCHTDSSVQEAIRAAPDLTGLPSPLPPQERGLQGKSQPL